MKKGTEGYVLVYVLAVFVLLSLACTAVCTFALNGLKVQRAALESDQQRYAAEGLVEQVSARLMEQEQGVVALTGSGFSDQAEAMEDLVEKYGTLIAQLEDEIEGVTASVEDKAWDDGASTYTFETKITAQQDSQQICAVLQVVLSVNVSSDSVEPEPPDPEAGEETKKYSVTSADLSYDSYQIETVEPEGGGGP